VVRKLACPEYQIKWESKIRDKCDRHDPRNGSGRAAPLLHGMGCQDINKKSEGDYQSMHGQQVKNDGDGYIHVAFPV
jgi:hypothetical protein